MRLWRYSQGSVAPDNAPPINGPRRHDTLVKGNRYIRSFGVVGAFDGHRAGVGRVVVDATWHHWFDMNLVGLPAGFPLQSDDQRKRLGFTSPENQGPEHLRRICRYFYNVADWLSPVGPHEQRVTERAEAGGNYLEIE